MGTKNLSWIEEGGSRRTSHCASVRPPVRAARESAWMKSGIISGWTSRRNGAVIVRSPKEDEQIVVRL